MQLLKSFRINIHLPSESVGQLLTQQALKPHGFLRLKQGYSQYESEEIPMKWLAFVFIAVLCATNQGTAELQEAMKGFLAVSPKNKVVTTWGDIKRSVWKD